MTKADISTLIDTNLASGSNIPASLHRDVEHAILNYIPNTPLNVGFITAFDVHTSGSKTVGGNISSAVVDSGSLNSMLCTMVNTMPSTNYLVKIFVESLGSDTDDFALFCPSFKIISTTQFNIITGEPSSHAQNLKLHLEIISLD